MKKTTCVSVYECVCFCAFAYSRYISVCNSSCRTNLFAKVRLSGNLPIWPPMKCGHKELPIDPNCTVAALCVGETQVVKSANGLETQQLQDSLTPRLAFWLAYSGLNSLHSGKQGKHSQHKDAKKPAPYHETMFEKIWSLNSQQLRGQCWETIRAHPRLSIMDHVTLLPIQACIIRHHWP